MIEVSRLLKRETREVEFTTHGNEAYSLTRPRASLSSLHIRFPRHPGGAPLPNAESDDASQSRRDTAGAVDLDLPVDQFGRIAAALQIVIGLDLVKIHVRNDKCDYRDRQHGNRGVVDTLGARAMGTGLRVLDVIMDKRRRTACKDK